MAKKIIASGGIGNRIAAVANAEYANVPVYWEDYGFHIPMEEIYPDGLQVEKCDSRDGGDVRWLFPNTNVNELGTINHFPEHERVPLNDKYHYVHWKDGCEKGTEEYIPKTKPNLDKFGNTIPANTLGIHLRLLHPHIHVNDTDELVYWINEVSQIRPVFVASDAALRGLSNRVHFNYNKMHNDYDRPIKKCYAALDDLATFGRCTELMRNSTISTFTQHYIFMERRKMTPLTVNNLKKIVGPTILNSSNYNT